MKVKQLEEENTKLKRMYAELALELNMAICHRKKALKLCVKRKLVRELNELYPRSISKACRIFKTSRSSLSYQSVKDDQVLMDALSQLSKDHPREGFWKFYYRNAGHSFNHKRVYWDMCRWDFLFEERLKNVLQLG